jgi:putative N6-adenine-specific DNA methylase
MHLFISCPPKLESLLTEELSALGIPARQWPRGASVVSSMEHVYRINMESRLATRVLWPLKHFECLDRDTLYKEALSIQWDEWLSDDSTFAIDANATLSEGFRNSHFAGLVVKDAICDYFREKTGQRPSVELRNPQIQLNLFIYKNKATISFDTSGAPLFKRGYRISTVEAPLQETLAAAILKLAGYRPEDILCDPFCGSGTFLWEAAMMSTQTPAGFFRDQWGFFKHPQFSLTDWNRYLQSVQSKRIPLRPYSIFAGDRDLNAIEACRATAASTGLPVHFQHTDIRLFRPPQIPTLVVTNPPYGIRLKSSTDPYTALAQFLETTCQGKASAAILSPTNRLPTRFPGKLMKPIPLVNGGLDVFLHLLEANS